MQAWILFATGIVVIAVVGIGTVVFVLMHNVRTALGPTTQGKYPQGHWMSIGMLIGIAIGCVPSLAAILFEGMSSFVGIGPAIGCGLGVAFGSALEQKHKNEIRPLTETEQKTRNWTIGILVLLALLGVVALGGMVWLLSR